VVEQSGWYLRGDVGIGVLNFSEFDHSQTNSAFVWPSTWTIVQQNIGDQTIFGGGIGYYFNNWLRFDVTGEYRTKSLFNVKGSYTNFCGGGGTCFDLNDGYYSSAVFMANAYLDLGTWWCLTPYIGAGVGTAYNRITGVEDVGLISDGTVGFGYAPVDHSEWDFAWNVQAGLTYNVSNNFKIDFNWRYMNLGSPQTAVVDCQNTAACPGAYYTLKNLTAQDFRIGFRWSLQPWLAPAPVPPLQTRG
jgi:opacity protein-like surface antigen